MTCLKVEVNHISSTWKKTFWANKIKKTILVFRSWSYASYTLNRVHEWNQQNQTRFDSRFIHFGTISVGSLPGWLIKSRNTHLNQAASSRKNIQTKRHGPLSTVTVVNKNGGASLRNRGTNSWRVPRCFAMPVVMQWPWPCRCRHDARVPQRPPCGHAPGYAPARCEKNMKRQHTSHLKHVFLLLLLLLQKKDIAPNKKNDKTGNFQLTIIDHNATMIPPMASAPVHVSFFFERKPWQPWNPWNLCPGWRWPGDERRSRCLDDWCPAVSHGLDRGWNVSARAIMTSWCLDSHEGCTYDQYMINIYIYNILYSIHRNNSS